MDLLVEFILELYGELMLVFVPEKNLSKKHIIIAKVIALCVVFATFALVIWGIYLISEKDSLLGILPIAAAVIISLLQIILGIIFYKKHH